MGKKAPKSDAATTASTLWKLALYTLAMMCVPLGLFLLVAEKYLDRECAHHCLGSTLKMI
jgi:hypothetical protein